MDVEHQEREYVWRYVRYGFYSAAEIERIVGRDVFGGAINHRRLREMIETEIGRKRDEEKSWPGVTDCDRLDAVFNALNEAGILALHNAGLTPSEGILEVGEQYLEAGAEASGIVGYCFYHRQDLEKVLAGGSLYLAYGDIQGDEGRGLDIGRRVYEKLVAAGFDVTWTGSIKDALVVRGIRWQRRTGHV